MRIKTYIILIITILFLLLNQFYYQWFNNFQWIIDQWFTELNNNFNIYKSLFIYDNTRAFGETQYMFWLNNLWESIFTYIILFFTWDIQITNFLKLFIEQLFVLLWGWILLYTTLKYILKREINKENIFYLSLFSLLFIFNIFFIQSSVWVLFWQRFSFLLFAIIFYFIHKVYFDDKWKLWLFFTFLLSNFCWWYITWFWLPLVWFLFIYSIFFFNYKFNIKIWSIYLLLIIPAILSIFFTYFYVDSWNNTMEKYANEVYYYANSNSSLKNIFAFIGWVNWWQNWWWNNEQVYHIYNLFKNFWIFFYTIFILLFFYLSFFKFKILKPQLRKYIYFMLFSLITCIFFIKSLNPPFWNIFTYFFDNFFVFKIFRESHNKFYYLLIFIVINLLFTFFLLNKSKIIKFIIYLYLLIFIILVSIVNIYSKSAFFNFDYVNNINKLSFLTKNDRVLFLPEVSYHKKYNNWYVWNSLKYYFIESSNFSIPFILDKNFNNQLVKSILNEFNYFDWYKGIYDFWKETPSFNEDLLNKWKLDYIVYDKNIIWNAWKSYVIYSSNYLIKLKKLKTYKTIFEDDDFIILKSTKNNSKISSNNEKNMFYDFNNVVNYDIKYNFIDNNKNIIYFFNLFDNWWKLYLKNQQWLFTKPLFENTHTKVYDYANWWTISKDEIIKYVEENYSKELKKEGYPKTLDNWKIDYKYYTLNPDWSIDVELTLYFKPQSYFYLGLIISGTTLLVLIGYLGYDTIRRRKNKNQTP